MMAAPTAADNSARPARAASAATSGHAAGKASPLPFALPEPGTGMGMETGMASPVPDADADPAADRAANSAADSESDGGEAVVQALALLAPADSPATAPALPVAAALPSTAAPAAESGATNNEPTIDADGFASPPGPAPAAARLAVEGGADPALAAADKGDAAAATAPSAAPSTIARPADGPAATSQTAASSTVTGPTAIGNAAGGSDADSAQDGRRESGQPKQGGNSLPATIATAEKPDHAAQLPPFRLESLPAAGQTAHGPVHGSVPAATGQTPAAALQRIEGAGQAGATEAAPDMAPDMAPDIVVETAAGRGLDITIAAHNADSLRRIEQARHQLAHALSELGTDVEAIRVELAPDRGPDNGAASADRGGQQGRGEQGQGEQRMSQTGSSRDGQERDGRDWQGQGARSPELSGDGRGQQRLRLSVVSGEHGASDPGRATPGRIDLYA